MRGPCSGLVSSKQIVPGRKVRAIHAVACCRSTTKSREPLRASSGATLKPSDKIQNRRPGFDAELTSTRAAVSFPVYVKAVARSRSRDLVVDLQQAMACIALTFRPGTICFELKLRSDQPRTRSPHAESSNSP